MNKLIFLIKDNYSYMDWSTLLVSLIVFSILILPFLIQEMSKWKLRYLLLYWFGGVIISGHILSSCPPEGVYAIFMAIFLGTGIGYSILNIRNSKEKIAGIISTCIFSLIIISLIILKVG